MATLATTAPALRHLAISVLHVNLPPASLWEFGPSLHLFHNLYSIDMTLAGSQVHSILSHLSSLPSLSTVRFDITDSAGLSGTGPTYLFPAVKLLHIRNESNVQALYFMAITHFDNLTDFKISCRRYRIDVESLFRAISLSCGKFLKSITIFGGRHDSIKISALYPLLRFTNLRSFRFRTKQTFCPTDEDIQCIAKSWPNLENFDLVSLNYEDPPQSLLTLTGLLSLIEKCPSLVWISIGVNAEHIPNLASPVNTLGLVIYIHTSQSPIGCPNSLADFLNLVLLEANIMILGEKGKRRSCWEKAISLRIPFYKVRWRREHYAKGIKEFDMAFDESERSGERLVALTR